MGLMIFTALMMTRPLPAVAVLAARRRLRVLAQVLRRQRVGVAGRVLVPGSANWYHQDHHGIPSAVKDLGGDPNGVYLVLRAVAVARPLRGSTRRACVRDPRDVRWSPAPGIGIGFSRRVGRRAFIAPEGRVEAWAPSRRISGFSLAAGITLP